MIEVMAVAVIIAILAAITYPIYQQAVRKAKRAEARAALMQLMQQQERYYSQNNSYIAFSAASTDDDEKRFKWFSGNSPEQSAYEISAAACRDDVIGNCVLLTARPGTDRVNRNFKDAECGELTLASTGVKSASGGGVHCWQ